MAVLEIELLQSLAQRILHKDCELLMIILACYLRHLYQYIFKFFKNEATVRVSIFIWGIKALQSEMMCSRSSQLTNSIAGIRKQIRTVPGHSVIQQITLTSPGVRKDLLIGDKTVLTTEARIF